MHNNVDFFTVALGVWMAGGVVSLSGDHHMHGAGTVSRSSAPISRR